MVSTRSQSTTEPNSKVTTKPGSRRKPGSKAQKERHETKVGSKRDLDEVQGRDGAQEEEPPKKKAKAEDEADMQKQEHPAEHAFQVGTIERGHIYFFYRPKVELEEAHSIDDVQRFHMLLVPRPPDFSVHSDDTKKVNDEDKMQLISEGGDAVPAPPTRNEHRKAFRLVSIGKKCLSDADTSGNAKGGGRKQMFWANINTVGNDLQKLEDGLGGKTYETKTRGTRHQGPARLAARGAYAIVNSEGRTPSSRKTHLGYHISHPSPKDLQEVQDALGIHPASSFVLQVKNPLAPNTGSTQSGLPSSKAADYPPDIMTNVFGKGGSKGRESFGLRFALVWKKEMLDYEGAELLLIASRSGESGLETALGEGRGKALTEAEAEESHASVEAIFQELAFDADKIPAESLKGHWI
ncbi:hypothetical protein EUX98_g1056 [Antrodiella citrinella]|uniref:Uncharacterized protein n=1 Tax=Antrodiella citrinella TaxID=2447956 RepID=A0A4S4N2E3_9APHY|nr:hypothetical protein EUX98_g1056 [Antrodiella citrinella]